MKAILCTLCTLFTISAMADTASFNIEIGMNNLVSGETVFSYNCDVKQTLTWQSQFNFFSCTDENGEKITYTNVPTNVGYDYNRRKAYSLWSLTGANGMIQQILSKKGMTLKLKASDPVQIYYGNRFLDLSSDEYLIEGENNAFSFTIYANGYLD